MRVPTPKSLLPLVALALLWTLLTPTPVDAADFDEAVAAMVQGVETGWNKGDPEAVASMFTKTADLHSRNGRWFQGPTEIAGYFAEWMAETDGVKDIDVRQARLLSEKLALVDVLSSIVPEKGAPERVTVTVVVERQLNGSWQFSAWRECTAIE